MHVHNQRSTQPYIVVSLYRMTCDKSVTETRRATALFLCAAAVILRPDSMSMLDGEHYVKREWRGRRVLADTIWGLTA